MSLSLSSLKGFIQGIIEGSIIGVTKGETRTSDYSSCQCVKKQSYFVVIFL